MVIGARTAAWSKSLPYDAEVEYLVGDGKAYIATGVYVGQNYTAECDYQMIGYDNSFRGVFGALSTNTERFMVYQYNESTLEWGWNTYRRLSGYSATTRRKVKIVDGKLIVNGTLIQTVTEKLPTTINRELLVFAFNYNLSSYKPMIGRMYGFKLWNGEHLFLDLVPVRKCGVGYMYDRVSRKLFANAGAGAFTVGPVVSAANGGGVS